MSDEINPYASPLAGSMPTDEPEAAHGPWRDDALLVMRKDDVLPDRCVKCNRPADGYRLARHLSALPRVWLPVWITLLMCQPPIFYVVYLLVRRTARIEIGVCDFHRRKRRQAMVVGWLTGLAGAGIFFLSPWQWGAPDYRWMMLGLITVLLGGVYGFLRSSIVLPAKIDRGYVWLSYVHQDYLAQLPEFGTR